MIRCRKLENSIFVLPMHSREVLLTCSLFPNESTYHFVEREGKVSSRRRYREVKMIGSRNWKVGKAEDVASSRWAHNLCLANEVSWDGRTPSAGSKAVPG